MCVVKFINLQSTGISGSEMRYFLALLCVLCFFITYSAEAANFPTRLPTKSPLAPSRSPSRTPTRPPSIKPSRAPTGAPNPPPSYEPTLIPTVEPTLTPSYLPSSTPTGLPTSQPTSQPSSRPTDFQARALYLAENLTGVQISGILIGFLGVFIICVFSFTKWRMCCKCKQCNENNCCKKKAHTAVPTSEDASLALLKAKYGTPPTVALSGPVVNPLHKV